MQRCDNEYWPVREQWLWCCLGPLSLFRGLRPALMFSPRRSTSTTMMKMATSEPQYIRQREATESYAKVFKQKVEDVTEALIERTSLRGHCWLIAKVHDWDDVDTGAIDTSSCWSFSDPKDETGVDGQNAQIATRRCQREM